MRTYILRRLLLIPLIMLLVSFMTHSTFRIIPGSVAEIKCGLQCTPQLIADTKHEYGLDRGFFEQYGSWLGVYTNEDGKVSGVLQGNFGKSFLTTLSVDGEIQDRLPVTRQVRL